MDMKLINKEYKLAEKIVFLQEALKTANDTLNKSGMIGVLPSSSVSFREASSHHAKVRKTLKNTF